MSHAHGEPAPDVRRTIVLHVDGKLDAAADAYRAILLQQPDEGMCWAPVSTPFDKLRNRSQRASL